MREWKSIIWAGLCWGMVTGAGGQEGYRNGFEGAEPAWHEVDADARYQVQIIRRQGNAHSGDGAEYVKLTAGNGSFVHIGLDVEAAAIIDELRPSLWLRANKPGLQFLAHVVLPRTIDPRTQQPLAVLLRGTQYTKVGQWEQLHLENAARQLARLVPIVQAQQGPQVVIDIREAYIDRFLLNIYGGAGTTDLWIDDVEVAGFVRQKVSQPVAAADVRPTKPRPEVALSESVLTVEGKPWMMRAIRYRGEPLQLLGEIGFNSVWLDQPPPPALLAEAEAANLWLICPPPEGPLNATYNRVLAWNVGLGLQGADIDKVAQRTAHIRQADSQPGRPLVCGPEDDLRGYSRHVEILVQRREPIGGGLELADYGKWLRERQLLARPGTPCWTFVQTQVSGDVARLMAQRVLEPTADTTRAARDPRAKYPLPADQLRLLAYLAVASGSRGLIFDSHSRLDVPDPPTLARARMLELLNLEFDLLAPFAAMGSWMGETATSEDQLTTAMLGTPWAKLILPLWLGSGSQWTVAPSPNEFSFVIPGVPQASEIYELTPSGLRPLKHQRVAGGERVFLRDFGLTSMILCTKDPATIATLRRRLAEVNRRAAQLAVAIAKREAEEMQKVMQGVAFFSAALYTNERLAASHASLEAAERSLAANDWTSAYRQATAAHRPLRLAARALWQESVARVDSPLMAPFAGSLATLPEQAFFMDQLRQSRLLQNQLPSGDFESLPALLQSGWKNRQYPTAGLTQTATLSDVEPHSGRYCLRLSASATASQTTPPLETPPVWIVSPPLNVTAGQWVRIHGYLRIPTPLQGVERCLIADSFTSPSLSLRYTHTDGWTEFTAFRQAPSDTPLTLTLALFSLGDIYLDDLTLTPLDLKPPLASEP